MCGQGIHEVCYQKVSSHDHPIPKIKGLHWLCDYCEPRILIGKQTYSQPIHHKEKGLVQMPSQPSQEAINANQSENITEHIHQNR